MVAQRDRNQPDAVGVRFRRGGKLQNPVGWKRADGQVVVARPAEPAQVRASPDDFHEKPGTELGFGRKDARGRRIERVCRFHGGLEDGKRRPRAGSDGKPAQRTVSRILRRVERRHIEAALPGEQPQQIRAVDGFTKRAVERGHQHLAFPCRDDVGKRRQRLGIDECHRAADEHQRMVRVAFGSVSRDTGQPEKRQDVHVVPFERHGERDDVELADRRLRFERDEGRFRGEQLGELLFRRQKHALAGDVVLGIQQAVNRLESEVRHPDPIGIGKGKRDPQATARWLADVAGFFRERCECAFALFPGFQWCGSWSSHVGVRGAVDLPSLSPRTPASRLLSFLPPEERRDVKG